MVNGPALPFLLAPGNAGHGAAAVSIATNASTSLPAGCSRRRAGMLTEKSSVARACTKSAAPIASPFSSTDARIAR